MDRKLERLYLRYARKGDSAALGRVFDLSCGELSGIARHLVPDAAAAEDVLQATYLTAIEKADRYEPGRGVMPWLVGILARHAARARRGAARRPDPSRLAERAVEDPAKRSEDAELGALVAAELDALPETYAAALRPHLVDGRPAREIGRALGISAGAASVRVHRGLKMLRERLPRTAAPAALGIVVDRAGMREALVAAASDSGPGAAASTTAATSGSTALTLTGGIAMKKSILMLGVGALAGAGAAQLVAIETGSRGPVGGSAPALAPTRTVEDGPSVETSLASPGEGVARDVAVIRPPGRGRSVAAPTDERVDPNAWLALLNSGDRAKQRDAIDGILALPPEAGLTIVSGVWGEVEDPLVRARIVTSFVESAHAGALDVLDLGVDDRDVGVQNQSLELASSVAFRPLDGDARAYAAWRAEVAGLSLVDAIVASARSFAAELGGLGISELVVRMGLIDDLAIEIGNALDVDLDAVLLSAGVEGAVVRILETEGPTALNALRRLSNRVRIHDLVQTVVDRRLGSPDADERARALELLGLIDVDEPYLRANVLPLLEDRSRETVGAVGAAARLLGKGGNDWAVDPLLDALGERRVVEGASFDVARALAKIGEPRAIPRMIAIIEAHGGYETTYGVGYFGLQELTGVRYDESHDGAFWRRWWESNRARFPEDVRKMKIPVLELMD